MYLVVYSISYTAITVISYIIHENDERENFKSFDRRFYNDVPEFS